MKFTLSQLRRALNEELGTKKIASKKLRRVINEELRLLSEAFTEFTSEMAEAGKFMKQGHSGDLVKKIQILVGANPDGKFGPNTEAKLKAFSGGQTQVNKESARKLFAKMSDAAKKKIEDLQREIKSKVDMDEEIPMDDEDESVGIDTDTVQSQWDTHVTGKKLRRARENPTLAFIDGIKGIGTDEGLVYASLYYSGGFSGIKHKSNLYRRKLGKESPEKALRGDMSGNEQKVGLWLGAEDRKDILGTDGEIKED